MMLSHLNYAVHAASSGEEAIECVQENHFMLVVLDMIMDPGMDGLDTFRQLLKIHPEQKAIILSGFSETDRVREAQKLGEGQYVFPSDTSK
jgi:two-component system, cell cycle sensor histidine kinase and response regulator CckA